MNPALEKELELRANVLQVLYEAFKGVLQKLKFL